MSSTTHDHPASDEPAASHKIELATASHHWNLALRDGLPTTPPAPPQDLVWASPSCPLPWPPVSEGDRS